jgi:hypothetical protein
MMLFQPPLFYRGNIRIYKVLFVTLRTPQYITDQTVCMLALFTRDHVACMRRIGIDRALANRKEGIIHCC